MAHDDSDPSEKNDNDEQHDEEGTANTLLPEQFVEDATEEQSDQSATQSTENTFSDIVSVERPIERVGWWVILQLLKTKHQQVQADAGDPTSMLDLLSLYPSLEYCRIHLDTVSWTGNDEDRFVKTVDRAFQQSEGTYVHLKKAGPSSDLGQAPAAFELSSEGMATIIETLEETDLTEDFPIGADDGLSKALEALREEFDSSENPPQMVFTRPWTTEFGLTQQHKKALAIAIRSGYGLIECRREKDVPRYRTYANYSRTYMLTPAAQPI